MIKVNQIPDVGTRCVSKKCVECDNANQYVTKWKLFEINIKDSTIILCDNCLVDLQEKLAYALEHIK